MLTVSMPTWNTPPELLHRAAASVLASDTELRLVVVDDQSPQPLKLPRDSRLIVHQLARNSGRYFADAVVISALDDGWWAVLDADDRVDPDHYGRILAAANNHGVAFSPYWRHQTGKPDLLQQPVTRKLKNLPRGFAHLAHWCSGIYRMDRVQRAGGIHPGFRVGFDTLFVLMVSRGGAVEVIDTPGYHWCRRDGDSLTTASDTRFGSPHRAKAKEQLRRIWARSWYVGPKDAIDETISKQLREQVEEEASRLRLSL